MSTAPRFWIEKFRWADLAPIEQAERDAVAERGAEFLHEVEHKGYQARSVGVEKAHLRI